jgi:hypothetical protein
VRNGPWNFEKQILLQGPSLREVNVNLGPKSKDESVSCVNMASRRQNRKTEKQNKQYLSDTPTLELGYVLWPSDYSSGCTEVSFDYYLRASLGKVDEIPQKSRPSSGQSKINGQLFKSSCRINPLANTLRSPFLPSNAIDYKPPQSN